MVPAKTVEDAIDIARGIVAKDPEIIVIPGGPSTIPFVLKTQDELRQLHQEDLCS
jgi:putative intracellular protease/amidase